MELIKDQRAKDLTARNAESGAPYLVVATEPDENDQQAYEGLISTQLSLEQIQRIVTPSQIYAKQQAMLAIHWHPEFIPLELIRKRIDTMFPNKEDELIIPTQHNVLVDWNGYIGVKVDCYSSGFKRKVQLLLHFRADQVSQAELLKSI